MKMKLQKKKNNPLDMRLVELDEQGNAGKVLGYILGWKEHGSLIYRATVNNLKGNIISKFANDPKEGILWILKKKYEM